MDIDELEMNEGFTGIELIKRVTQFTKLSDIILAEELYLVLAQHSYEGI